MAPMNRPLQVFTTVSLTTFAYRRKRPLIYFCAPTPGQRPTVVLKELERASVSNFMPGNIIFDIVLVEPANLTVAHITQAYQLRPSQAELAQQLLEKAQQRKLLGLEINPS